MRVNENRPREGARRRFDPTRPAAKQVNRDNPQVKADYVKSKAADAKNRVLIDRNGGKHDPDAVARHWHPIVARALLREEGSR
jgi:hypothetical protein